MPVKFIKQTEQLNGFYLIEFEADGDIDLPINLTVNLDLDLTIPEHPDTPAAYQLALFSQTNQSNTTHLTFLSHTGFPATESLAGQNIIQLTIEKLQNYQASPSNPVSNPNPSNYSLKGFKAGLPAEKTLCFLVAESALAQAFYLGKSLQNEFSMVMILESQAGFPFAVKPAQFMFEDLPDEAVSMIGACPLLEDWGIPNRLCSPVGTPGCFDGDLKTFKSLWQPPADWHLITL